MFGISDTAPTYGIVYVRILIIRIPLTTKGLSKTYRLLPTTYLYYPSSAVSGPFKGARQPGPLGPWEGWDLPGLQGKPAAGHRRSGSWGHPDLGRGPPEPCRPGEGGAGADRPRGLGRVHAMGHESLTHILSNE